MNQKKSKHSLTRLVIIAVLIALGLVLSLLTIGTNIWQVSLVFVTNTLIGAVGGPVLSGLAGGIQDIIQALFFSHYGYNWQFTLSAFIVGSIYGVFFYGRRFSIQKVGDWFYVFLAVLTVMLVDSIFFNTLWVSLLYKMPFKVALLARLPLLIQVIPRTLIIILVLPVLQNIPQLAKHLNLKKN